MQSLFEGAELLDCHMRRLFHEIPHIRRRVQRYHLTDNRICEFLPDSVCEVAHNTLMFICVQVPDRSIWSLLIFIEATMNEAAAACAATAAAAAANSG